MPGIPSISDMPHLAVVVVHYRTPELVRPAVQALLGGCEVAGVECEIVLVDNGSEASDHESWIGLPVRRLAPGGNLGYAGGVSAGVEASSAPLVVAMNPDVVVEPDCLKHLLDAIDDGADAAGPMFTWDASGRVLLPPTEERSMAAEMMALLARLSRPLAKRARHRWRRHARRHWQATSAIVSTSLSGALLAFRRDSWNRVGPFDSGYPLYFEETDWLLRLKHAGGQSRFVPRARAGHWYAQSSLHEPSAERWFEEAQRRFRQRHYGLGAARALEVLERVSARTARPLTTPAASPPGAGDTPWLDGGALGITGSGSWVELSPDSRGFPAAAEFLPAGATRWSLPEEIWSRRGTPALVVRGLSPHGEESTPRPLVGGTRGGPGGER